MRYRIHLLLPGSSRARLISEGPSERASVARIRWEAAFVALLLVLMGLPCIAHGEDTNPYAADPDAAEDGRALYFGSGCAPCHGPVGEGAIGPNLVDDEWMYRFSPGMVYRTMRNGRRGTRMISYKDRLTEDETWKIVEFLLATGREIKATQGE